MSARLTAETRTLRAISESEFADWVLDVAKAYGWRSAHFRPARTKDGWRTPVQGDGAGFPDMILLHPRCDFGVALELKRETGRTSGAQEAWIAAFRRTGWVAMVVRPSDREAIRALLAHPHARVPTGQADRMSVSLHASRLDGR
jgi:hypothetical protein